MGYEQKIRTTRDFQSEDQKRRDRIEVSVESDRGRIINCSAVRRLQQRTQVFPLEEDAAIRSRLTHSLEVQQTGRYIAKEILSQARSNGIILFEVENQEELQSYQDAFISLVEMACLLHDVGNPPFGHFGERAFQEWARKNLPDIFINISLKNDNKEIDQRSLLDDLENFDGNAQGIRLIVALQQLNLTYSQIASFLKYTRGAFEKQEKDKIDKKPGFFFSEKGIVDSIRKDLLIDSRNRYPLSYIMEAADDICYSIADFDDALDKGIVKITDFLDFLEKRESVSESIIETIRGFDCSSKKQEHNNPNAYFIIRLRVELQKNLVPKIAKLYLARHDEIFEGRLDESLLDLSENKESDNEWFKVLKLMKIFAREKIFSDRKICEMEIKGYKIIYDLLDIFKSVLKVPFDIFLCDDIFRKEYPLEYRLYNRLPSKYKIAYKNKKEIYNEDKFLELYYRTRLIFDYISGMTDNFALKEYQVLSGIKQ